MLSLWRWLCWSLVTSYVSGQDYNITWCWPKLWEGKSWSLQITHTDQGPDVWEKTTEISLDVIGQRMALHERGVRSGQEYDVFSLYYYPARTLYKVENGVCTTENIDGQVLGCKVIPDDHITEYMAKTVLGSYETSQNDGVFIFAIGRDVATDISEFYMVDMNQYYPLIDEVRGDLNGESSYQVSYYYDATEGIKDPGIFTPPDICLKRTRRTELGDTVQG